MNDNQLAFKRQFNRNRIRVFVCYPPTGGKQAFRSWVEAKEYALSLGLVAVPARIKRAGRPIVKVLRSTK